MEKFIECLSNLPGIVLNILHVSSSLILARVLRFGWLFPLFVD
jgi:hypothetical protein